MLLLNIMHLIQDKTISINYNLKTWNSNKNTIFIYNNTTSTILEIIELLNSLYLIYLYIYKYSLFNQKMLFSNSIIHYSATIKYMALITSNYYTNISLEPGFFTNWVLFKKQLLLYKWLEYLFITHLTLKTNNIFRSSMFYYLYTIYIKLKLKYNGIKYLNNLPNTILLLTPTHTSILLKEAIKLNKYIILITDKKLPFKSTYNIYKLTNINLRKLKFIMAIIVTAFIQGTLK